jgi:hypothetical protein
MYKRALLPLDGSMVAEAIVPFRPEIAGLACWIWRSWRAPATSRRT